MNGHSDSSLPPPLDQWLVDLGFVRGNPFATLAADQERPLLPQFYVDVDGYEQIKGAGSIVVFAPRGGGKSALRVVLAGQSFPQSPLSSSLAVEFTDFDPLISHYRTRQSLAVEAYVTHLLRLAAKTLFNALCPDPTEPASTSSANLLHEARLARIGALQAPARVRLAGLIQAHYPGLLEPFALYERLNHLNPEFEPDWLTFETHATQRQLRQFIATGLLANNPTAGLIANLNDYQAAQSHRPVTPREQIEDFIVVARAVGFNFTQILIDRLDENRETVDDPALQASIIEPLLANLPILELPGIALKFFLSKETRDELINRPKIRRDRLTDQAVTVTWDVSGLKKLLDTRLDVYSDGRVPDLIQLFHQSFHQSGGQLVGEWVEQDMLRVAQRSPRRLLLAGRLLFEAHLARVEIPGLLDVVDWELARPELMRRMPPLLQLSITERIARIGDRTIPLTPQHHKILAALAASGGQCDREALVQAVWETTAGVSNAAVDKAINRLRDVLEDDADSPVYLSTLYGHGFKLMNFELAGS